MADHASNMYRHSLHNSVATNLVIRTILRSNQCSPVPSVRMFSIRCCHDLRSPFSAYLRGVVLPAGILWLSGTVILLQGAEARPAGISSLAAKEVARREAKLLEAHAQLVEAGLLFDKSKYSEALRLYRDSYDALPEAPLTAASKLAARDGYSRAAHAEARKLAEAARYAEARALLKTVLEQSFNPGHEDSIKLLKQLEDPDRYNPAPRDP